MRCLDWPSSVLVLVALLSMQGELSGFAGVEQQLMLFLRIQHIMPTIQNILLISLLFGVTLCIFRSSCYFSLEELY